MKVLVAEDDVKMSSLLYKSLSAQAMSVDVANDGEQALYLAGLSQYDVILLDVVLPGIDGVEVCKRLRERGISSPVIHLSGLAEVQDKVRALDSGADDYLAKPFSFSELLARVRAVMRRGGSHEVETLVCPEFTLDCNRRMVICEDESMTLSAKEFRLLEYLVRNREKVVSRYEILENVWGSAELSLSNVVDVYISRLRSKLRKVTGKTLIRTVRDAGYILESC